METKMTTEVLQIATYEQIATLLSKIAVNYSNMSSKFFDVFLSPTPQDITLQIYDASGNLQSYTIPNRAKDFTYILNGEGTPEGTVEASVGAIYQDRTNGKLYIKESGTGVTGWVEIYAGKEILTNSGNPEGTLIASVGTLCIDTLTGNLYTKTPSSSTQSSSEGWQLISANTNSLVNKSLSNLNSTGESHFAHPDFDNLEEGAANRILPSLPGTSGTILASNGTTGVWTDPTTLAANKDLSNLSSTGESHFASLSLDNVNSTGANRLVPDSNSSSSGKILVSSGTSGVWSTPSSTASLTSSFAKIDLSNATISSTFQGLLNNISAKTDLSNVSNANMLSKIKASGEIYLKTTYVSGTSGYNIWSNGYCEQWGQITSGDPANTKVTLSKTFSNTNYQVLLTEHEMSDWWGDWGYGTNTKTTSSFYIYGKVQSHKITWRAFGYLASGQF